MCAEGDETLAHFLRKCEKLPLHSAFSPVYAAVFQKITSDDDLSSSVLCLNVLSNEKLDR